MAIFPLQNIRLDLRNISPQKDATSLEVYSVSEIFEWDANGLRKEKIIGFSIDCAGYRGAVLSVKFPMIVQKKCEELKKELEKDSRIFIKFSNLKLSAYALKGNNGSIISGVSARATDFSIVTSSDEEEIDDIQI